MCGLKGVALTGWGGLPNFPPVVGRSVGRADGIAALVCWFDG